tara:strand:+ start:2753 stop:3517 length:765 start_codon:yes stop_codon:yes gene_type:complete
MAMMRKPALKKFQVTDAYKTAPKSMPVLELVLRMASTFGDARYGKMRFDTVILGDDPLLGLCVAVHHLRQGKKVLIAPDSLSTKDWPSEEWGAIRANIQNHYDEQVHEELQRHLNDLGPKDGLQKALKILIRECAEQGQVLLLVDDYLQSSSGHIKGNERTIFFPLNKAHGHAPKLNPLWQLVSRKLPCLRFNHAEIEYIQAGLMINTSPVSSFIDPALCEPLSPARTSSEEQPLKWCRNDSVRYAFSNIERTQ